MKLRRVLILSTAVALLPLGTAAAHGEGEPAGSVTTAATSQSVVGRQNTNPSVVRECGTLKESTRFKLCANYPNPSGIRIKMGGPEPVFASCSTSFTVFKKGDFTKKYALTAGHCVNQTRPAVYSESDYFGLVGDVHYTNDQDSALVAPEPGLRLDNTVFRGDRPNSTKRALVSGISEPGRKGRVCVGGSYTLEVCNLLVRHSKPRCYNFELRDGTKVRRCGLMTAQKSDHRVVQPGDSGGPVYEEDEDGRVNAVGIIIGGDETAGGPFPEHDVVFYRPIAEVLKDQNAELQVCGPADICD